MVDFNNDTTIGTPAVDVVRILVLQRHSDMIEAWESHLKKKYAGVQSNGTVVRARIMSLFLQIHPTIKRKLDPKDYEALVFSLKSGDEDIIEANILLLNEVLDEVKITRIDTKKQYDKTNVETEDKMKGL